MTDGGWPVRQPLMQDWFAVDEPSPDVFRIHEPLHRENVKSFLVVGSRCALLIDTGMGVGDIRAVVESITSLPVAVVNSHAHWDHIGGNWRFDDISIHEAEARVLDEGVSNDVLRPWFQPEHLRGPLPEGVSAESLRYPPAPATAMLRGGERFELGNRTLEVIHCPGHSPGGIALWDHRHRVLFSTDVSYPCTLYVYDDADLTTYLASLERLASLQPRPLAILGSHCDVEMAVSMLLAQRDAFAAIVNGLAPNSEPDGEIVRWEFDGFAVELAPPE